MTNFKHYLSYSSSFLYGGDENRRMGTACLPSRSQASGDFDAVLTFRKVGKRRFSHTGDFFDFFLVLRRLKTEHIGLDLWYPGYMLRAPVLAQYMLR